MSKVGEVCRHVRSKNAGPFWVTIDLFFRDEELFRRCRDTAALGRSCSNVSTERTRISSSACRWTAFAWLRFHFRA